MCVKHDGGRSVVLAGCRRAYTQATVGLRGSEAQHNTSDLGRVLFWIVTDYRLGVALCAGGFAACAELRRAGSNNPPECAPLQVVAARPDISRIRGPSHKTLKGRAEVGPPREGKMCGDARTQRRTRCASGEARRERGAESKTRNSNMIHLRARRHEAGAGRDQVAQCDATKRAPVRAQARRHEPHHSVPGLSPAGWPRRVRAEYPREGRRRTTPRYKTSIGRRGPSPQERPTPQPLTSAGADNRGFTLARAQLAREGRRPHEYDVNYMRCPPGEPPIRCCLFQDTRIFQSHPKTPVQRRIVGMTQTMMTQRRTDESV